MHKRKNCPPLLLGDYYKVCHMNQYPQGMTKLVSYLTPRMSRLEGQDKLILFGLQAFIQKYLIDYFNENFFARDKREVIFEYERILKNTLGAQNFNTKNIEALHNLGYLPLMIRALPEGTRVPIQVPMLEITNTHKDFAWCVNAIESLLSCSLWHPMISANVGYMYRQIVNKWFDKTVDSSIPRARALGDFAMRGQESLESAIASSAAWLLSFLNTATIPAINYLENYYNCTSDYEDVGFGSPSTEHSVMNSNFAVDGNEITMLKRLLTEIYPHSNFSAVCDSYDYWNFVDNIIPACKEEILAHDGLFLVRGDSGDPVEIVTETVRKLWNIFGGTINSKGYKVLDPHIKAIYGDSITPQRADKIYHILEQNGFAAQNVTLGVGSFSMQCLEQGDQLMPYTRDTFGIAVKSTYCEINGEPIQIFKDPKTDTGNFKKSQKGCIRVTQVNGEYQWKDHLTWDDAWIESNCLEEVFYNGVLVKVYNLKEIRDRLHEGKF